MASDITLKLDGFRNAGYPDDPIVHGLVAGLWSSLSGIGRFVSRAGSGILVDHVGFETTAAVAFTLQCAVVSVAIILLERCQPYLRV
jgi:hypothetical protein